VKFCTLLYFNLNKTNKMNKDNLVILLAVEQYRTGAGIVKARSIEQFKKLRTANIAAFMVNELGLHLYNSEAIKDERGLNPEGTSIIDFLPAARMDFVREDGENVSLRLGYYVRVIEREKRARIKVDPSKVIKSDPVFRSEIFGI
jgi:hypothetical protein